MNAVGTMGKLGRWTANNFKIVLGAWIVIALVLGFFAPRVEHALSGAGWEATGSESVEVREAIDEQFGGMSSSALMVVLSSDDQKWTDPEFKASIGEVESTLSSSEDVSAVVVPGKGGWISEDGKTVVVQAGAASDPNQMVRAADDLKGELN